MTTPYVGEIRIFGFPRVPTGWFACDGSLKPISEYNTLYALLGTTYGGNGTTTFGLPDLRGQLPLHWGTGSNLTPRVLGELGGTENVTLQIGQMPAHTHSVMVTTNAASTATPGSAVLPGAVTGDTMYITNLTGAIPIALAAASVGQAGQGVGHDNTMPTLTLSICMAWAGIFPSRN
jgi:microcystin-dependent protein